MKKGLKFTRGERQLKRILETPLLPQGKATVAVSSEAVDTIKTLKRIGYDVFEIEPNSKLSAPVASHPDCNLLQLDKKTFVCDEDVTPSFIGYIKKSNIVNNLTIGKETINDEQVTVKK